MPKSTGRIGGFAAHNSGEIRDCYSIVRLNAKKGTAGGFLWENTGTAAKSFYSGSVRRLAGGFSADGTGTAESCYFFHHEKKGAKSLERLRDPLSGLRYKELKDQEDTKNLGFDMDTVWEFIDRSQRLRFLAEHWMYDVAQSPKWGQFLAYNTECDGVKGEQAVIRETVITKAEELWELAEKINGGDRLLASSYIRLAADIDLGGKEWTPIGNERTQPFTGLFDGCGYTIKNFVIKDKKTENKGFFGFLKGEVYNLTVDCHIKGGACAGGLAAQNDGGIIGCCAAIVEMKGKNGLMGGLCGRNSGTIFQSYAAGKMLWGLIPLFWGSSFLMLPLLVFLLLVAILIAFLFKPWDGLFPTYAPVPYDQDQIPIPNESMAPNAAGNFVSFQFEQEITVSLATGLCKFGFKNPGNSNHNIVVQLQFTDAQATRVMGSTGRTESEQQKLDRNPSYDPENHRMVIAQSGAIQPGYQLEDLRLVSQPNGATIPPGSYNAMVYLVFYDINTNERAMLESQLPVVIKVE